MFNLFDINQIVNAIISLFFIEINIILIAAIGILWEFFIYQFLSPDISFPYVLENGHLPNLNNIWIPVSTGYGYGAVAQTGMDFSVNLNVIILNYIVAPIFSIMLILAGMSYLLRHTFKRTENIIEYVPRIFFSVILAYFSIYIADIAMEFGKTIYTFFYSGLNITWSGYPSPVIGLENLAYWPWNYFINISATEYTTNGFIEFLVLVTLVTVMFLFLIIIVMRVVWIYFFIIILPVGSLFLMHPKTEIVGKRIWLSFIDRIFEICYMAPLLLLLIFIQDPLFWIAIFVVSMLVPYVVSFSLSKMGYPRTYSFFPRFLFFENSANIGKGGMKVLSGGLTSNLSLLPKNSGGKNI